MYLDRSNPLPLWAQLLADLRRRLDAGEFAERFPTDRELMDHYGLSRHTVRDAVRRLQEAGLLERARGRGTFVRPTLLEQPLGTLYSLFKSIEAQGREQRSEVLALEEGHDERAAEMLGVTVEEPLVHLARVRFADSLAIAVDHSWLPASIGRPLLEADFTHTALYAELAVRCGVTPVSGWERIRPQLPTAEQRRLLGISARQPVFGIERVAGSAELVLEWRTAVLRGDLFAYVARWGPGGELATSLVPEEGRVLGGEPVEGP
jgi:GntR family transcriptional regulator